MEYVGEHLLPGQLGRLFVLLSFSTALIATIAYGLSVRNTAYAKLAKFSFIGHALSVLGIVLSLFYIMLNHYFEYDYAWKHTNLELPLRYIFSAFWEGQEGSFLLWMFWNAVLGLLVLFFNKSFKEGTLAVFSAVQAFLASMLMGVYLFGIKIGSSPFILLRQTEDNFGLPWTKVPDYLEKFPAFMDGTGLNPLLQNYWMTIHPPVLFLGFASTLPVFALAMAALFQNKLKEWVKPALPWAFFSVGILGLGILMGGAWAYEALSFGGFWAWDPVENSSLVPWIIMVGAAHLMLVYRNRQKALMAAMVFALLSFLLILYSTFLTRSGVLGDSSVHSFVDLGLSGQLLIYLLSFVVTSIVMLLIRWKNFPKTEGEDALSSREFWLFIASLVLLVSAFQIIFTTSIPVLNALIGPEGWIPLMDNKVAPPLDAIAHYNRWQVPITIVLTLLIATGQFLHYRKTDGNTFWKSIALSLAVSVVFTVLLAQLYDFWRDIPYLMLLFTSLFAVFSNLDYWLRLRGAKWNFGGSSVAHLGFALLIAGALISNARKEIVSNTTVYLGEDFPSSENALLELKDTTDLSVYSAIWQGMREGDNGKQFYDVQYFERQEDSSLQAVFTLSPFLQLSEQMGPTPNPDTKHYWDRDLYTHITYSSLLEDQSADGYGKEVEATVAKGDTVLYQDHFVIFDSLKVNLALNEETGEPKMLRLEAVLDVVNVMGEHFEARPVYYFEDNIESYEDAFVDLPKFKFRLDGVGEGQGEIVLKAYQLQPEQEDFIVMKAIVFPLINLLWLGCILMVVGTFIAVYQRVKIS